MESFIAEAAAWTTPAEVTAVATLLEMTLELIGVPPNWDRVAGFYLEAFEDVPIDLVEKALRALRASHRAHWKFPKPADLIDSIRDDLERRRHILRRARACLALSSLRHLPAAPEPARYEDLSQEEREAFKAKMDAYFAERGGRPKPRSDDIGTDPGPSMRPVREILDEAVRLMVPAEQSANLGE